jgi:hypothetical protein
MPLVTSDITMADRSLPFQIDDQLALSSFGAKGEQVFLRGLNVAQQFCCQLSEPQVRAANTLRRLNARASLAERRQPHGCSPHLLR